MKVNVNEKTYNHIEFNYEKILINVLNSTNYNVQEMLFIFDRFITTCDNKLEIISYLKEIENNLKSISTIVNFELEDKLDEIKNNAIDTDIGDFLTNILININFNISNSFKYLNLIDDRGYDEEVNKLLKNVNKTFEKLNAIMKYDFHFTCTY